MIDRISALEGRTLVIGHYCGRAGVDEDNELVFFASSKNMRDVPYRTTLAELLARRDPALERADVILILDSCYSGTATRGLNLVGRSAEVIASVGATQTAFGNDPDIARIQQNTFTSRLATEVSRRVGRGASSVSFSELVYELRRKSNVDRQPEYHLKLGGIGIRVPVLGRAGPGATFASQPLPLSQRLEASSSDSFASAQTTPSAERTNVNVVFVAHIETVDPASDEVARLVDWVHTLHPDIGLELSSVFRAESTYLVLQAPWPVWARLKDFDAFTTMFEVYGGNQLPEILSRLRSSRPARRPSSVPATTRRPRQQPQQPPQQPPGVLARVADLPRPYRPRPAPEDDEEC